MSNDRWLFTYRLGFRYSAIQFEHVLRVIWQSTNCEQLEELLRGLRNLQKASISAINLLILPLTANVDTNHGPSCYAYRQNFRGSDTPPTCPMQACGPQTHNQTHCGPGSPTPTPTTAVFTCAVQTESFSRVKPRTKRTYLMPPRDAVYPLLPPSRSRQEMFLFLLRQGA